MLETNGFFDICETFPQIKNDLYFVKSIYHRIFLFRKFRKYMKKYDFERKCNIYWHFYPIWYTISAIKKHYEKQLHSDCENVGQKFGER